MTMRLEKVKYFTSLKGLILSSGKLGSIIYPDWAISFGISTHETHSYHPTCYLQLHQGAWAKKWYGVVVYRVLISANL